MTPTKDVDTKVHIIHHFSSLTSKLPDCNPSPHFTTQPHSYIYTNTVKISKQQYEQLTEKKIANNPHTLDILNRTLVGETYTFEHWKLCTQVQNNEDIVGIKSSYKHL